MPSVDSLDDPDLEALLDRWDELRESGESPSAAELTQDPVLRLRLERAIAEILATEAAFGGVPAPPPPAQGVRGRYESLEPHDAGGMGVVYHAYDRELGREVAYKVIQPDLRSDPRSVEKFLNEARITAKLQHPGVVAVHGLTTDADGRPSYAMRFVKGVPLLEVVKNFHESHQPPPTSRADWQPLLNHFVRVCQTIGHAHSQKILHRDLAPRNILLVHDAETLVIDWGLAIDRKQDSDDQSIADVDREAPTRAGTAPYTAPEVWDSPTRPGFQADIYSLGALLYLILTGRPPYLGNSNLEVIKRLREGPPPDVNTIQPGVPRPLAKICAKAMSREPGQRYATAELLAADINSWLAGERVSADTEPWRETAWRWAGHHRTSMGIAATVLLAIATGGPIAFLRERGLRGQAEAASSRADELAGMAQSALDFTVDTGVTDDPNLLDAVPISLRKDVAQRVIPYYDKLIGLEGDDSAARAGVAKTLVARAKLRHTLGTPEEERAAVDDCLKAIDHYTNAVQSPDNKFGLGRALLTLGGIFGPQGQFQKAITYLTQARPVLERLVTEHPDRTDYRFALALCLNNEANCHRFLGDQQQEAKSNEEATREYQSAEHTYSEALEHARELVRQSPTKPRYVEWLSRTWGNIGELQLARGNISSTTKNDSAGHALREAKEIALELARKVPNVSSIRECLATASLNFAGYLNGEGQHAAAFDEFEQARISYDRLNILHPESMDFRLGQAMARKFMGEVLVALTKPVEARTMLEEAARHYDALVTDYPQMKPIAEERNQLREMLAQLGQGAGSSR
jgi:eukaryotic-like serine/threonine-protein kinase